MVFQDECSFVSLRDVDRVLTVMSWFYQQSRGSNNTLFNLMNRKQPDRTVNSSEEEDDDEAKENIVYRQVIFVAYTFNFCYHFVYIIY